MGHIAKIFQNGRSQAVRLPVEYRFDTAEVYIRRDTDTGDVILSQKPESWRDFFELLATLEIPGDFMADRQQQAPQERDLL